MTRFLPVFLLMGCSPATWEVQIWGEEYAEQGMPSAVFADGCEATFSTFEVQVAEAALLDGSGDPVVELDPGRFDLVEPGPQLLGSAEAPSGTYTTTRFVIGPTDGDSLHAVGELTCGTSTVAFDWTFDTTSTYLCEPDALTLSSGATSSTELTVHVDHLFYDGLVDPEAAVRGQALVDADDGDGILTQAELETVAVAGLGYTVGSHSDVTDLGAFVAFLTRTVGHVNGEGHCSVDL